MKKAVSNRKLFIFLSVLLSFTLLLQSGAVAAPFSVAAEEIISSAPIETTKKAVIQSEEIALRNEFEKHFVMSDGTGLAIAYADPVHEKLSDGSWKEIDNTLSLVDGRYRNSAEGFKASFAQSSSTQQLVSVESKGYTLSWSLSMLKANLGYEVMSRGNLTDGTELQAVAPITSAALVENPVRSSFNQLSDTEIIESAAAPSKLTYANAFGSGINIEYGVKAYGVKENVILQNANTGFRGYKVHVASAGLTAQKDETNAIDFSDAEGNVQFTVQAPYMLDAADNVSGDIAVTLTQSATGYDITYIPNAQWLSEATYPMAINSSANSSQAASNLIDTYTYEGDSTADSSTRENLDRMFVGNKAVSGTSRKHLGYFKFKTIPTIPTGKAFQSASVVLRCPNGTETSQPFDLYDVPRDWVTTDFCWSNRPVATYKLCTAAIRNTSTNDVLFFGTGNNRHLSILVGNWYTGIYANYGFMVCYTSASDSVADYNAFYTSNCSTTSVRPYLIVNYETMDSAVSNGTYYIRNVSTGKYLTVNGNGASGSNVVPAGFSGLSTQRWVVTKLSDGNYKLSPAINTSVRLLNDGSRPTDGNNISVHSGYYGLSMEFSISYNLDSNGNPVYGQYRIGTRITGGNSFVADIGTNIVQKNYAANNNQVWAFEKITSVTQLDTPQIGQEKSNWCWAASAYMMAETNGSAEVTQSQIVYAVHNSYDNLGISTDEQRLKAYNYAASYRENHQVVVGYLPQSLLDAELLSGDAVAMTRQLCANGDIYSLHVSVIFGKVVTENRTIYLIRDPFPKEYYEGEAWPTNNSGHTVAKTYSQLVDEVSDLSDDYYTVYWQWVYTVIR